MKRPFRPSVYGPINTVFLVDWSEITCDGLCRLGRTQKQIAVRTQGVMQNFHHLGLDIPIEIDQQVATRYQVQLRKWGIPQDVVDRKQHLFPYLPFHAQMLILSVEILPQPGRGDIGNDRSGIPAGACRGNSALVDVGRKYLYWPGCGQQAVLVGEKHGDRVGLFAGSASHRPGTDLFRLLHLLENMWNDIALQRVKSDAVAKEIRDADEHVLE